MMSAKSSSGGNSSARSSKGGHVNVAKGDARPRRAAFPARRLPRFAGKLLHGIPFVRRIGGSEPNSPTHGRKLSWRARPQASQAQSAGLKTAPWVTDPSALSLGASAREAMRRRSRAKIAEAYSLERMTRDTLSVYAEALSR